MYLRKFFKGPFSGVKEWYNVFFKKGKKKKKKARSFPHIPSLVLCKDLYLSSRLNTGAGVERETEMGDKRAHSCKPLLF